MVKKFLSKKIVRSSRVLMRLSNMGGFDVTLRFCGRKSR